MLNGHIMIMEIMKFWKGAYSIEFGYKCGTDLTTFCKDNVRTKCLDFFYLLFDNDPLGMSTYFVYVEVFYFIMLLIRTGYSKQ